MSAGHIQGSRYENAALGLTYEIPKSVEVDSKFAATASPDALLAALDRKWKLGRHQNMVLLAAAQTDLSPEQLSASKVADLQGRTGFRWIEQPHNLEVNGVSGLFSAWELGTAAGSFAIRDGKYLLVWSFGATDEKSLRELAESIKSIRLAVQP